ncbi:50S ribosome-binding GTPase [Candidatus Woesearchaeota archaeon]|nr:50S ribosome-binding GTPase [Candidatus Woesearchaeota archaeon]
MNLQGLGKIETWEKYLDIAFKNAMKSAQQARQDTISKSRVIKSRRVEIARIDTFAKTLTNTLDSIEKKFPSIDQLAPFYQELIRATLDYKMLKQSLGALNWAKKQITGLLHKYTKELSQTTKLEQFNKLRTAFSGRTSSIIKQIKPNLEYLEQCRKTMRNYPTLKTKTNTIVITGAPNVGKSTLLAVLTGSKPQTASYPFTTQKLNLGYDAEGNQYIDTPGLLDRPLEKRNPIEKQAILALKHLATMIIFIIDPTETCGYTLMQQKNLLQNIKKEFTQPIILASNKADTGAKYKNAIEISAKEGTGIDKLKKEITSLLKPKQEQPQQ